ncbi:MAG: helix-turn-helix transcriptional regulator [Dehalococcoidia bacterium]|nr:helix-turn-helix transcriptional regulator [Dehalococcoidia bacterium]
MGKSDPDRGAEPVPDEPAHGVTPYCPHFQETVELIGRRWSGVIIRALLAGAVRFSDILTRVPGLSDRLLSDRLRQLEAEGIVKRTVYPDTPVRIEYELTTKGRELETIVRALDTWAARWTEGYDAPAAQG